jgi:hypothetical protein
MVTPVCATLEAVLVAAAVCEPAKEVPVTVEEALGGRGVTVAMLEPLVAGVVAIAISESVPAATTRRIVPPVENQGKQVENMY